MNRLRRTAIWVHVTILLFGIAVFLTASWGMAKDTSSEKKYADEKAEVNIAVDLLSQYVWRGYALSNDSLVIQPSMTVSYKGFSANIWGNLDTEEYNSFDHHGDTNWNETDLTLSYNLEVFNRVSAKVGGIYYALDSAVDSLEVFGGLSANLPWLTVSFTIYRDVWNYPGWWFQFDISRSFNLPFFETSLDLGTGFIYQASNDADAYPDPDDASDAYSDFHAGYISAALNIPLHKYITVSAKVNYSFPLGGDASDAIKGLSLDEKSSHVYGGLGLSFSF